MRRNVAQMMREFWEVEEEGVWEKEEEGVSRRGEGRGNSLIMMRSTKRELWEEECRSNDEGGGGGSFESRRKRELWEEEGGSFERRRKREFREDEKGVPSSWWSGGGGGGRGTLERRKKMDFREEEEEGLSRGRGRSFERRTKREFWEEEEEELSELSLPPPLKNPCSSYLILTLILIVKIIFPTLFIENVMNVEVDPILNRHREVPLHFDLHSLPLIGCSSSFWPTWRGTSNDR